MSSRYTADGKRKSSMTHAQRGWTCYCGRRVFGNGGKSSHKRACLVYAEHWLPRLEELLAENEMPATRHQLEAERDQLRERLGLAGGEKP
jgi:hypothetical protein